MLRTVDDTGDHFETRHRRQDGTIFDVEISTNGAVLAGQKLVFCVCRDISQRKAAERALRASEENYRLLVKQIPAVVFKGYADWSIDCFDHKIETLTGYPKDDFDSRRLKWSDLILEEDLPAAKAKFLEALKTAGAYVREYRIRQKSGEVIWVHVQGQIFRDAAGKIDHISGVIFDVSDRKRAEEELRKERDLSISIMESLPGVFYLIDEQGRLTRWNKNLEAISQYSGQEILAMHPLDFFAGPDKERIREAMQTVFATGEAHLEADLIFKDGGKAPYFLTGRHIIMEGRPHLVGMGLDISALRQMEEALQESEQRFRDIADNAMEWIWEVDAQGRFTYASAVVANLLGYQPEEVINRPFYDFFHPDDRQELKERALEIMTSNSTFREFIGRHLHKDGRSVWMMTGGVGIRDDQGNLLGYRGGCTDITARLQAEKALQASERFLSSVFASIQDYITILDSDLNIMRVNPARERAFAQQMPLVGKKCYEVLHGASQPCEDCSALRTMETGEPTQKIETFSLADREDLRYINTSTFPLMDEASGKVTGVVEVARDITEQKQAEAALIASEANYRTIFNAVNDGIFVHDARTGAILDVNQNVLDFTKRKLEEIKGLNIEDITLGESPYTHQEALAWIQKAAAGEPQLFRWRGKNRSGRLYWWEMNLKRVNLGEKECVLAVARNITGRLLAREALQESEKRYLSMFEDSPISLWQEDFSEVHSYLQTLRNQGVQDIRAYLAAHPGTVARCADLVKLFDVNKATLKIYEAESKEELFRGLRYVVADESYQVFQQIIIALAEGRTTFESEGRTQTLKGNKLHIITRLSVIPGFEQTLSRVLVSIIDITERKRAEEAMRKYEFITSASKEYMTLINRDYVYEAANAAYCRAHQKTREEVVGQTIAAIWGEQTFENIIKKYLDRCFTGRPVEFEGWFSFHRQAKGYYQVSYTPFFNMDGAVAYAAVVTHDITKRKKAEEALVESQKRYRSIFENAPIAIFQSTLEGKLIDVNPEAARSLGYASPREMIAAANRTSISETLYVDPQFRPAFMRRVSEGHGQWLEAEARLRRKDGEEIVTRMLTRQLHGDSGQVEGFVEDITERLRAEEEKRQLESQLFQSQKMEAVGTLAGGIAHDFNNILASMLGYAELALDDTPEGTDLRANLVQVLRGCQRAKDLIKQILTFSRHDQQERQPVQVSLILKEVLKFLRASLPATIDIRRNIAASSGKILADSTQIHQVLLNLCTNAAQAMEERGGVIDIALAEVDLPAGNQELGADLAPGPYLTLTVSDTGKGMTPEVMNRIFEPFFTTKAPGQGTGLGLAVVHGIVKSHGGAIQVGSEPGKGSAFKVFFPKIEDQKIVEPATLTKIPRGQETILLVDDEKDLVELWEETLQRLGYQVVGTTSSIEALETFQAKPDRFDLVITDQTMPQMTGIALAKELLRLRPELPIILCTGFTDPARVENIKALGIREMVNKPLSKAEIAIIIRKVLDKES